MIWGRYVKVGHLDPEGKQVRTESGLGTKWVDRNNTLP